MYVTDLWPDNVEIVAGIKNKHILNIIGTMVDYIYRHCDRIFTSSESFIEAINQRGVMYGKLEFWPQYAEDYYAPVDRNLAIVSEIPQDEHFNIIFAGNIGVAQGLDILPVAARLLKQQKIKVRFNIVGDGRYKDTLINKVNECDVSEMFNFVAKQPPTRIPDFMAVCDATLISLSKSKVFSITLPAKTQSCLACGIPIIVSADGEIQNVIVKAGAGVCGDAGNAEQLANNIQKLALSSSGELQQMSQNALDYYNNTFDKNMLLNKLDPWFNLSNLKNGDSKYVQR